MNLLSVDQLTKSYGERVLFQNISFGVNQGQKVALVAKNGSGKSTLFQILMGKNIADSGKVTFRKDIRVSFLEQEPFFQNGITVSDALFAGDNVVLDAVKEYEKAVDLVTHDSNDANQEKLQNAMIKMDTLQAWDYETKVKQILSQLNIPDLSKTVDSMSGGQKKRLALARILIEEPQFVLMDEPTNHLDVDMIEWLENYLERNQMSVLMVTHDRYFLDNVCDEIIELDNKTLYHYAGNYAYFLEKKAEREFNADQEITKARNTFRKELEWVRKQPKARGTKSKSRLDAFDDLTEKIAGRKIEKELQLNVKMSRVGGKILELEGVKKQFGDLKIINQFDYVFKRGDRIGIVGKNGVGKSTFLNIILGLEKADAGKISPGETIVFGYFDQKGLKIKEDKRVVEVVKDIAEFIPLADGTSLSASMLLTQFLFPPELQYTFVSKLSGGEKRRLHLLTVLMKNPNFLILDEPTNDLDLDSLSVLEDFLENYKGCVIIVTHDRYFMDKLVDHLFIFEGNGVIDGFTGNYTDYRLEKMLKEKVAEQKNKTPQNTVSPAKVIEVETKPKAKISFKEKQEYETLEKEIAALEAKKIEHENSLSKVNLNHEAIAEAGQNISKIAEEIDLKSLRWIELSEKM